MIKVMLIEDEEIIRKILKKMIEQVEGFQVIAEAGTFADAVREFSVSKPDVVFVDVDLDGDSGLECAKVMTNLDPNLKVVFATAHSEYMANAFEIYAFDYLVKPFDAERLNKTLVRIKTALAPAGLGHTDSPAGTDPDNVKLIVKGREQTFFVDKKDIIMIERVDSATNIVTLQDTYRSNASLSDLEEKLPANFMRSHKSYIINVDRIWKTEVYGRWTYIVKFKGRTETALITSQKYEELKKRFE